MRGRHQSCGSGSAVPGGAVRSRCCHLLIFSILHSLGLQVLFLSRSLPGLVSPLLSSSGVLLPSFHIRPLGQSYWPGCAWRGAMCGAKAASSWHRLRAQFPSRGTTALSLLLLGSGSMGGARSGTAACPVLLPGRWRVSHSSVSVCLCAQLPLRCLPRFLSWGLQSLFGLSPPEDAARPAGFPPLAPFWGVVFLTYPKGFIGDFYSRGKSLFGW